MSHDTQVTVRTHLNSIEAHALQGYLQAHGVRAFIENEHMTHNMEISPMFSGGAHVRVLLEDEARARQLLVRMAEETDALMELDEEDALPTRRALTCPSCKSHDIGLGYEFHAAAIAVFLVLFLSAIAVIPGLSFAVLLVILLPASRLFKMRCGSCGERGDRDHFEGGANTTR